MALLCDSTTDRLYRTANLPLRTAFTLCGWAERVSHAGVYGAFAGISIGTSSPNHAYELAWGSDGLLEMTTYQEPSGSTNFTTNYGNGVPFFWAMTGNGSTITGYAGAVATVALQTITPGTPEAFTAGVVWIGDNGWGESAMVRVAAVKCWDAVLTAAELEVERWRYIPARTTNLNFFWPCIDSVAANLVKDFGPNARPATTAGSNGVAPGPPIVWAPRGRRRAVVAAVPPAGHPALRRFGMTRHAAVGIPRRAVLMT